MITPLVLLVDDDPSILKLAQHLLSKRKWKVESVESADAAIEFMKKSRPKLLITDIQMPGQDGLALTAYSVKSYPEVPVVILTGHGSEQTAIDCFRLGAADYVRKENIKEELFLCAAKLLHDEKMLVESDSPSEPNTQTTKSSDKGEFKGNWRQDLEGEYIVRQWGNNVISASSAKAEEREFSEQRLRVLRRQVERLDKWSAITNQCLDKRKSDRHAFADVIYMIPLDKTGNVEVDKRFVAFCRNVSEKGCSIIRNGLLREKKWAIFFPHRGPIDSRSCCIRATMVRDKTIPLGMYEMGFTFEEAIELRQEDVVVMLSQKQSGTASQR